MLDRIDLRQVLIGAARAKLSVYAVRGTVSNCADYVVGKAIGGCHHKSLEIGATFEEIGIEKIRVQRVLLDVLPVTSELPGVLAASRSAYQTEAVFGADRDAD